MSCVGCSAVSPGGWGSLHSHSGDTGELLCPGPWDPALSNSHPKGIPKAAAQSCGSLSEQD